MSIVRLGPEYFPLTSAGRPVSNADIFVGIVDLDPEIPANQIQLSVQQEDGNIVNVAQPISTGAGGVPLYNGSPVTLLVSGDYSLKVLDSTGSQIYYVPSVAGDDGILSVDSITDLRLTDATGASAAVSLGYYAPGDGGGGSFYWDAASVAADDGFLVFKVASVTTGRWRRLAADPINAAMSGAVGDGIVDDTDAILALEAGVTDNDEVDLLEGVYNTTITPNASNPPLDKRYFNGTINLLNVDGNLEAQKTGRLVNDFEAARPRTKSPVVGWESKSVLWLGTSIPHQGTDIDSYPTLFGQSLNCSVDNLSWSGSHASYDVDGDAFDKLTISALSMTEDDRLAGLALYGGSSAYDDSFDPITKASKMTADYRIGSQFISKAYEVVVLDHNHNDRRLDHGILSPPTTAITAITTGATTDVTVSDASGISVGDSIGLLVVGIAELNYFAGRVEAKATNTLTLNVDSSAMVGSFSSGTATVFDKNTLFGTFEFLIYFIKNASIRYSDGNVVIILSGAPSEHTGDVVFDNSVHAVGEGIKSLAEKWDFSFFDIGFLYDIKAHDQLAYFPDGTHPSTLETRKVLSSQWVRWAVGGAIPSVNPLEFLSRGEGSLIDNGNASYSKYDDAWMSRGRFIDTGVTVLDEDFSAGLGAWTVVGTTPTTPADPWGGGGSALLVESTVAVPLTSIYQDIAFGEHPTANFDLYLPSISFTASGSKIVSIMNLLTPSEAYSLQLVISGSQVNLRFAYFKSPGVDQVTLAKIPLNLQAGVRYSIGVDIVKASADEPGFLYLTIDDVAAQRAELLTELQAAITRIQLGVTFSNLGEDIDIYFGNVVGFAKGEVAKRYVSTKFYNFTSGDATPSVAQGNNFITNGATAITDFDDGTEGQIIYIHASAAITITDGANLMLSGTADYLMTVQDTLTLQFREDGTWRELSRMVR